MAVVSPVAGNCKIVPEWDNRFFDFGSSCYEQEKLLFSNRQAEVENLFGIDAIYVQVQFDVDRDPLFKEDPSQYASRMFKFKATVQGDLPTLERKFAISGIFRDDVMKINCNMMHFAHFSKFDYSTSATWEPMEGPRVGDFIFTEYNKFWWRIIHQTNAAAQTQFHEEQTNWQITMRPWVNNKIRLKPEEGTNPEDFSALDKLIFEKDIFDDNPEVLEKEESKTSYKPRLTESPTLNTPDNPFGKW